MTKAEKAAYIEKKAIGYWSELGGIEVKDIQYGVEDYVVVVCNAWSGEKSVCKARIQTTSKGNEYIVLYGHRYHFSNCLRT